MTAAFTMLAVCWCYVTAPAALSLSDLLHHLPRIVNSLSLSKGQMHQLLD